jgi:hypothetical protein
LALRVGGGVRLTSTRTKKINCVETPARGRPWPENAPKHHRQTKKEEKKEKQTKNTTVTNKGQSYFGLYFFFVNGLKSKKTNEHHTAKLR